LVLRFFFSSRRRHTRWPRDWSSDVCSSDLDFYHSLLRTSWLRTLLLLASAFLLVNVVFAFAYAEAGGVANARPGSLLDAFFFSEIGRASCRERGWMLVGDL